MECTRRTGRIVAAIRCIGFTLALAVSVLALAGVAGPSEGDGAVAEAPALASPKERLSYALGMVLGSQFRSQSVDVDFERYVRGLRDALDGGKTLLTETEARAAVNELQSELKRKRIAPQAAAAPAGIEVSFKLDPRLTKGLYMGERWVSPPTYHAVAQDAETVTVEARAHVVGTRGASVKISPEWLPANPEMVTVTPGRGDEVRIIVRREGESKLKVASPGLSSELTVKAARQDNALRVEISK